MNYKKKTITNSKNESIRSLNKRCIKLQGISINLMNTFNFSDAYPTYRSLTFTLH